jgi:hypothetical protein
MDGKAIPSGVAEVMGINERNRTAQSRVEQDPKLEIQIVK